MKFYPAYRRIPALCPGLLALFLTLPLCGAEVEVMRVPDGGIQPQVAVAQNGAVHLVYFKGDPAHGDIFYVARPASATAWSAPVRVNDSPGAALAIGSVRGAQMALGRSNVIHVAWMGSSQAPPVRLNGRDQAPLLYTHFNPATGKFEPARNLISFAGGLDGGGSVAADALGRVAVVWHGGLDLEAGEQARAVYVRESVDDGAHFAIEKVVSPDGAGSCACCGLKSGYGPDGALRIVYRSAATPMDRAELLLAGKMNDLPFRTLSRSSWAVNACPMSTAALDAGSGGFSAAWETAGQIWWQKFPSGSSGTNQMIAAPGEKGGRKHPSLATNRRGETLVAWAEGTGWQRGGSVAWQMFDSQDKPAGPVEHRDGVPVWGLVAAAAKADDGFLLIY